MRKLTGNVLAVTAMVMLAGISAAHAADGVNNTTNMSTSGTDSLSHFYDDYYVNFFTNFHGAALNRLDSPYTLNQQGNPTTNQIYFDSEVTTAYMFNRDIGVGPDIPFQLSPVMGKGFTLGDVGVKAFNAAAVKTDNLRIYANFLLQAPTATYDSNRGMWMGFKMTPYAMYHFSGSRFTVGAWTEEKLYAGAYAGKIFKLYAQPYVNYKLTSNLALNMGYEMETDHMAGSQGMLNFTSYETDLQPGFVWQINQKMLVNPFLQLFTGNRVGMDTTAFGAIFSATLL